MKQYLIDFFKYNDWANRLILQAMKTMPDSAEAVKLFGHMSFSFQKWLNRITSVKPDSALSWDNLTPPLDKLEPFWAEGFHDWLKYLDSIPETELQKEIQFNRPTDNKRFSIKIIDIALQINYHQIHHRAQIARMIRLQGQTPPATDYIFTKFMEV
jgi:uncharacterized damage-inducible protein DinB